METKRYEEVIRDRDETGTVKKIDTVPTPGVVSPATGPSVGAHEDVQPTGASPVMPGASGTDPGYPRPTEVSGGFNYGYGDWRGPAPGGIGGGDRTIGLLNSFLR